ncbi:DNA-directed RNA polymerase II [Actinomyces wuliandei]|uniref:DNA-directed RNA polymerase II n=1 Tax=Actinomyces wuliandei TaxID=2057743 RepID=UPI001FAA8159|nr:DNA-directed RNA polymerase II [Actinomyces wuliandei]
MRPVPTVPRLPPGASAAARAVAASAARRPGAAVCLPYATAVAVLLLLLLVSPVMPVRASADTTTGSSTTGTASTVSPSTVAMGGTVVYTVSGFPRGATVQVLVDDGALAAPTGPDAGVVTTLHIDEDGTASGALDLPAYVGLGDHWLRFRAIAGPDVATSDLRTTEYTNKSPYFTVAGVTVIGGASQASPVPSEDDGALASSTATASVGASRRPTPAVALAGAEREPSKDFLLVGTAVLAVSLVVVVLAGVVIVNRRRLAGLDGRWS